MNADILIKGLSHPNPQVRLQVVQIIHLADEVATLPALAEQYKAETDTTVKEAMLPAGRRLRELDAGGYTTLDAIFRFFQIDAEITAADPEDEARLLKEVQENAQLQMLREHLDAQGSRNVQKAAVLLGGTILGGVGTGMLLATNMMSDIGADVLSSNLTGGIDPGKRRMPPTAPGSTDVRLQTRRLREDPDAARRRTAALDLGSLNNPTALPALAAAFLGDPDPDVRAAAARFGKIIYWNAVYWQMTQNGSFDAEYQRRKALIPQNEPVPHFSESPTIPKPLPAAELADILRRVEEARRKRGK